jgi:hypothetical protein
MDSIRLFFGLFVMVAAIYFGVELVPPYYANYQLQDAINNEALLATNSSRTEEAIQESVLKQAQQLGIDVTQDDIKVHRTGSQFSGSVTIEVPYTVHVDMPGFPFDLHFDPATTNKGVF